MSGLRPENDTNYFGDNVFEDFEDYADDSCPNCGGEGVVYSCFEEWACMDPEGGCDLCERRCDWCRPARPALQGASNG